MTTSMKNRSKAARLAFCALTALAVTTPALSAHAGAAFKDPVSVTVEMPVIETAQDRTEALEAFRDKAVKACKVNGVRGLAAYKTQQNCADELVEVFAAKLDETPSAIALAARDDAEKSES